MYHVNGYALNGKIKYVWPFQYISTNFEFTKGQAYGNLFIPREDARWKDLIESAQGIISGLPKTRDLFFHIEVFEKQGNVFNETSPFKYSLCEIAARRPGGSIGLLIDQLEGGRFQEMEFRVGINLVPLHRSKQGQECIGDMMVPLRKGVLESIPSGDTVVPIENVLYKPIAKPGTRYEGFDILKMNTCCRFIAKGRDTNEVQERLEQGLLWFNDNVVYS
jgi:hypothetical protein